MIPDHLVRLLATNANDLSRAAKICGAYDDSQWWLDEVDEAESGLVEARNTVEAIVSAILRTFGVRADVELHRIAADGVE